MSSPRRRVPALAATLVVTLLAVAGCSSSGSGTASTSTSKGTTDASSTSSQKSCINEAATIVARSKGPLQQEFPEPFDAKSVAGKTFWLISVTQAAPSVVAQTNGFAAAAAAVGAKAVVFDGKGSPVLFNQGVNSAVAQHAAGILLDGLDPALVKTGIASAAAAHIPVIDALGGQPDGPLAPGVVSHVTFDAMQEGKLEADYAAARTGCNVHAVLFYAQTSGATVLIANGAKAELTRLCPKTCNIDLQNVDAATFATSLTPLTENILQRSPDINFLMTSSDSFVTYMVAGEKALKKTTPVIGVTGTTLALAQAGSPQVADILWPPLTMCGYLFFDATMRAQAGQQNTIPLALRLVDKSNWGTGTSDANLYPNLVGFQAKFKKLWGAGS